MINDGMAAMALVCLYNQTVSVVGWLEYFWKRVRKQEQATSGQYEDLPKC